MTDDVNGDILEREPITFSRRCSQCGRETVQPLEDGQCAACLTFRSHQPQRLWRVDVPGEDGLFGFSLLYPTRESAVAAMEHWPTAKLRETTW